MYWDQPIRLLWAFAAGNEILLPDAPRHLRKRKGIQTAPHVSVAISIAQPPNEQRIQRSPQYHSELAQSRHGIGQVPVRDTHSHAALYDARKLKHCGDCFTPGPPRDVSCDANII